MTKARLSALTLGLLLIGGACAPKAWAEDAACRVGDTGYQSLSEAVTEVMSGKAAGEIELLRDCTLDVGAVTAPVTIRGGGHSVVIPAQSRSENGALSVNSTLRFSAAQVSLSNPGSWSAVIGSKGALELVEGSHCSFTASGIYASPDAVISLDASSMSLENMRYTCMMAEAYGQLRLANGSELGISKPMGINGITGFDISLDASGLSVTDCPRQGLVKCNLTLSNGAWADISGNGTGYNLYSYNVLTVNGGTSLRMNGNASAAILMQGKSSVHILPEGYFECRENGKAWKAENTDAAYGSKAAVNIGWFNAQYIYTGGVVNIEDGAQAAISDNYSRALTNYGRVYLGDGSVVTGNGALAEGEGPSARRVELGGGVNNHGSLTLAEGAVLDNNHASLGGDDIYNAEDGALSLPVVRKGRALDETADTKDCGHQITGWFRDEIGRRWNAHGEDLFMEELAAGDYSEALELKAAHGILPAPATGDVSMPALWLALLLVSGAGLLLMGLRRRDRR